MYLILRLFFCKQTFKDGIWGMVTDADTDGLSAISSAGYQTMIPLFDLFEASYSYIKHDMVMLMLDMRDLR